MKSRKILVLLLVATFLFPHLANSDDKKVSDRYLNCKIALIPVHYSDVEPTLTYDKIENAFKNTDNPQSLASYIKAISYGKFNLDFGSFKPSKWLNLKKEKYDYEVKPGTILFEPQTETFIKDSIKLAINNGLNLDEYDKNGDGRPDYYIIVVAGSSTSEVPYRAANIYCEKYDQYESNHDEWMAEILTLHFISSSLMPLFSHRKIEPVGLWDVIANTGGNLVGMNIFNRWKLGVVDIKTISEPGTYEIDELNGDGSNKGYMIKMPGTKDEWIILENRQKTGIDSWFHGIPRTGIVMYHYDNARPYDYNFNFFYYDDTNSSQIAFGLKVFDTENGKYHENAVWCKDIGKVEMSFRNSPDNQPLGSPGYAGRHITIKNISKSGSKMTFELAYENNSPDHMTDVETLDFGKVRKGLKKTLPIKFLYNGAGDVKCDFSSNSPWITVDPKVTILGQDTINVSVDTSELDFGNRSGKLEYRTNSFEGAVNITLEVTNPVGDVNGDFKVTIEDADLFMKHYDTKVGDLDFDIASDFNGDGLVNIDDFFLISRYFVTK